MIARLRHLVTSEAFSRFIIAVIIVNAVTLGMQTSTTLNTRWGDWLGRLDQIALAIFYGRDRLAIAGDSTRFAA